VLESFDIVTGRDWLGFGGIAPTSVPVISAEQQFAEKLHASLLPRERVNTRTKGGARDVHEARDARCAARTRSAARSVGTGVRCVGERVRSRDENGRGIRGGARIRADTRDVGAGKREEKNGRSGISVRTGFREEIQGVVRPRQNVV
jgi:hypothetical protein